MRTRSKAAFALVPTRVPPLAVSSSCDERRLLRNIFARKPLDKCREHGGLGIGYREPVHARAARTGDVESAYRA